MKSHFVVVLSLILATRCYAAQKPNIVMFYIDDWAWNGSPVAMDDVMKNSRVPVLQMPNVEKLARQGMKFRSAYGSPQCSPARACIQTGQSNPRNGLAVYLNSKELYYDTQKEYRSFPLVANIADRELDDDAVTIAEALKRLGYVSADVPTLFDLSGDTGEVTNIAQQHPEKHQRLYKQMMRYLIQVGARFPKTNPDYDPEAYKLDRKTRERLQWGPFAGQRSLEDDEI